MANTDKFTVEQVEEALWQAAGLRYGAAEKLKCSPSTVTNYIKRHKRLQRAIEEAKESTLDMAEAQLINLMKDGDRTAIIFFLKTQGKDRGYVERQELTGSADGDPIHYVVEAPPLIEDYEQWAATFKPKPEVAENK